MNKVRNHWPQLRTEALNSVNLLAELLESEESQRRLLEGYLESKILLADAFQALLLERISGRSAMLDGVKSAVELKMRDLYAGAVPEKYLRVRGYTSPHPELLGYLSLHVGQPVSAAALRVLTADAVHTERRVRELRDLGLDLLASKTGGRDVYVLHSLQPETDLAAVNLVGKNIRSDKSIPLVAREDFLKLLD